MKFTKYFEYTKQKPDRIDIKEECIVKAFYSPIFEEIQSDNRIRRCAKIPEDDDKFLRIVILEYNETIHNAFFDPSFKEKI